MIKTKTDTVTQEIGLWAIPKSDTRYGEFPFSYELYGTNTHWRTGAIFVAMVTIQTLVPEGVDLMAKAHETLDKRQAAARTVYDDAMEQIAKDRQRLYMLAAPPVGGMELEDGVVLLDHEEDLVPDEAPVGIRTYGEPIDYNEE